MPDIAMPLRRSIMSAECTRSMPASMAVTAMLASCAALRMDAPSAASSRATTGLSCRATVHKINTCSQQRERAQKHFWTIVNCLALASVPYLMVCIFPCQQEITQSRCLLLGNPAVSPAAVLAHP